MPVDLKIRLIMVVSCNGRKPFCVTAGLNFLVHDHIFPIGTLKKEGESCGSCFCPPTFTAGECEHGLKCDLSIQEQIPDAPGICRAANGGSGRHFA